MTPDALLTSLKIDLGISSKAYDDQLLARLQTAIEEVTAAGVTLNGSARDQNLVLMYAAYLWRSRVTGEGMPRMLRYALNNRVFGEKARKGVQA